MTMKEVLKEYYYIDKPVKVWHGFLGALDNRINSLEGSPEKVTDDFFVNKCNLYTLEGAPKYIGGEFRCNSNHFRSLKGCPKEVGKDFWCVDGEFYFSEEDIRAVCKVYLNDSKRSVERILSYR
jgi:hypothetical protein